MQDIVVIPTYNERNNIRVIVDEILDAYDNLQVMVVDDSSPDGTADVVRQLESKYPGQVELLLRKEKNGLGEAYKDALLRIQKRPEIRYVFTMDADGSHSPKYLATMRESLRDHDLVVGSRYITDGGVAEWETWRKALSYYGNKYSSIVTGVPIADLTAGFIGMRKSMLDNVDFGEFTSSGYAYQIEFKSHCFINKGARVTEIPITFLSRREGESKLSHQIIHEGVLTPVKILWKKIRA
ncbi:MAG: polyprenol monophosphomannose synthase [Patescibacteria group bacterium]